MLTNGFASLTGFAKKYFNALMSYYSTLKTTLQKPSPSAALALGGGEAFFKSDDYLIPVLEDDPLLRRYR
jgi:hypothetical protein